MKPHLKQLFLLLIIFLAACSAGNELASTPAPTLTTSLPTSTPALTATDTSTPTATRVTKTPKPSPSPTPTLPEKIAKLSEMMMDCYLVKYSPDQTWAAGTCTLDEVWVVNISETTTWKISYKHHFVDRLKESAVPDGGFVPLFWSPDGRYLYLSVALSVSGPIYYVDGWGLLRLDLESGHIVDILEPSPNHLYTFSFSPDGQYLAYILRRYDPMILNIVDLKTGEHVNFGVLNKYNQAGNILWSPDQRMIVFEQAIIDYYDDQHLFSVIAVNLATGSRQVLVLDNPVKMKPDLWIGNNKLELSCEDGIRRVYDFEENVLYEK